VRLRSAIKRGKGNMAVSLGEAWDFQQEKKIASLSEG
jgi:hypothetical protein